MNVPRLAATIVSASCLLAWSLPAVASPESEAVAACLSDSTNGKDRKDLARWIFIAMATHPSIKTLANVPPQEGEQSSRVVAALVTRLITESCPGEVQRLVKAEGPQALGPAFEYLGKLAVRELTDSDDVKKSISQFEQYVDRSKIASVLSPRQKP